MTYSKNKSLYFILFCGLFLKLICIGFYEIYDTTEARYAAIAMRMVLQKDYLTPWFLQDVPFLGKPPLSFWATAISFKIFGFGEFFARLPHFLAMLLTLAIGFNFVKEFRSTQEAILFSLILSTSLIFWILAGSVMTDAFLCLGITLVNTSFFYAVNKINSYKYWYLFGLGIAISILSKGIVGIAISGMICFLYVLVQKKWRHLLNIHFILSCGLGIIIAAPWFVMMEQKHAGFLEYFIIGEHFARFINSSWEGDKYGFAHSYPPFMIVIFLIISSVQWFFYGAFKAYKTRGILTFKPDYNFFILLTFLVPLVFFSFAKNIIIPYTSLMIIGFAMLVSLICKNIFKESKKAIYLLTVPFIIIYFISSFGIKIFIETDKALIKTFQNLKNENDVLYYNVKPKFNAYFYSQDKIIFSTNISHENLHFIVSHKNDVDFQNFKTLECNKKLCLYEK